MDNREQLLVLIRLGIIALAGWFKLDPGFIDFLGPVVEELIANVAILIQTIGLIIDRVKQGGVRAKNTAKLGYRLILLG